MLITDVQPKLDKKRVPSHKIVKMTENGTSSSVQLRVDPKDEFFKNFHEYAITSSFEDLGFVKPETKSPDKVDLEKTGNHPDQQKLLDE